MTLTGYFHGHASGSSTRTEAPGRRLDTPDRAASGEPTGATDAGMSEVLDKMFT